MPLPYKIILTLIVLSVGAVVAWTEFSGEQAYLGWIVIATMAVMILGQWVFPEAGGGKPTGKPSGETTETPRKEIPRN